MFTTYRNDLIAALSAVDDSSVYRLVQFLYKARYQSAGVYILGNGGSSATASHFAGDLVKVGGLRAVALSDCTPAVTAFGNDDGWVYMYANLLRKLLLPNDVVIAISCSGNSPNVVKAIRTAKDVNIPTIKTAALVGANPECDLLREHLDVSISVPFKDIRVQEDVHLAICHCVAGALHAARPTPSHRSLS
jgi:D-sedoheptulose 7-phosphate isomerase